MEKVTVSTDALRQVLQALNVPGHYIRELQVTRDFPGNPIKTLIKEFNAAVKAWGKPETPNDGLGVCKSCKHRHTEGYCLNEKLAEERGQSKKGRDDMLIYDYNEGGGFWVGERFGCIHHTPNEIVERLRLCSPLERRVSRLPSTKRGILKGNNIMSNLSFSQALNHLKNGIKMQRTGWNGKGLWVELQTPTKTVK